MKIELAQYAGFCMGVRRALSLCMESIRKKNIPICTLGPIIHNSTVIEELESYGIKNIKTPEEVKEGDYVLIRTHGVTPQIRSALSKRGAKIIDATCPKVARVQGIIRKHVANGYFIVIIGDHGHAETQGLLGYAEDRGRILSTKDEVEKFAAAMDVNQKLCVVAQTTQEMEIFNDLCSILTERFSDIKIINTICDATRNRQEEIRIRSNVYSSIFVVGGKESANTKRLFEIAQKICPETQLIERANEINLEALVNKKNVLVTAGASTPLWIAYEAVERIASRSFLNKLLSVTGSKYMYWISALLAIVVSHMICPDHDKFITSMLFLGACIMLSRGTIYLYLKKLDVFRLDYFYGKISLFAGLTLLAFLAVFFTYKAVFFLLYYCILFYVIYKNIAVGRNIFFTLCNFIFFLVPFVVL